ncbi:MAG TPA: metallophosphoesterase family protein [Polyangiales bacterium]|nr:metallophosphoesterase family protein [Polyangiales bacterium]
MRIALVSDIHGNQLALEAVLRDVRAQGVEQVACLGDVATLGPQPLAVLHALEELGCPCIMGNHDEFLLKPELVARYTKAEVIAEAIAWCHDQLGPRELAFIASFQATAKLPLDGEHSLFLFHGSPDSHTCDLLVTTPEAELDHALSGRKAAVMAGGHTHIQMLRQHRGTLLLNPGSVGMPFERFVAGARPTIMPYAEYAVVSAAHGRIAVDLRRVQLDKRALRDAAASWPQAPSLLRADLMLQYA